MHRQIFGGGAAAHGDIHGVIGAGAQLAVGAQDLLLQWFRQCGGGDLVADGAAAPSQIFHVAGVETGQDISQIVFERGALKRVQYASAVMAKPFGILIPCGANSR